MEELFEFPTRLLQSEPWGAWILQRGGLGALQSYLSSLPLAPDEQRLLGLLIERPRETAQIYAQLLSVARATYFRLRSALLAALAIHLNAWQPERAAPRQASRQEQLGPAQLALAALPAQTTPLIGREREVAELWLLLQRAGVRLITLTGPGGIGKTRLALELAYKQSESAGSVCFVSLVALHDPSHLALTIAQALGLKACRGQALPELLCAYLRDKQLLLMLDNFEHVIEGATLVAQLLNEAPQLQVLATSREALQIYGEHEVAVPPLSMPQEGAALDPDMLGCFEATRLFLDRVKALRHSFRLEQSDAATIVAICRRLDALPLAIELAAARARLLSPQAILERLDNRLDLLVGRRRDLPERQQTLRATIDWSYNLLDPTEQTLFARLATFAGGCTLEAAESICQIGVQELSVVLNLESLLAKSLVYQQPEPGGGMRFLMLETIREYASERLAASGEQEALQANHARYYRNLAQLAFQALRGHQQKEWLDLLELEANNLRAALHWASAHAPELAAQTAGLLWRFWYLRGHLDEGRRWLDGVLASPAALPSPMRALALEGAGWLSSSQGDYVRALAYADECLALRRELNDQPGIALNFYQQGQVARSQGSYEQASVLYRQGLAIARNYQDRWLIAAILNSLGSVFLQQGKLDQARCWLEESLELTRQVGDKERLSTVLLNLGLLSLQEQAYEQAQHYLEQSKALSAELGDRIGMARSLSNLGLLLFQQRKYEQAQHYLEQSKALSAELGDEVGLAICLNNLGDIAFEWGNTQQARAYYHESLLLSRSFNNMHLLVVCISGLASVAALQHPQHAARLFGALDRMAQQIEGERTIPAGARHTSALTSLQHTLGQACFRSLWESGRALTAEQLLTLALGQPSPPPADAAKQLARGAQGQPHGLW